MDRPSPTSAAFLVVLLLLLLIRACDEAGGSPSAGAEPHVEDTPPFEAKAPPCVDVDVPLTLSNARCRPLQVRRVLTDTSDPHREPHTSTFYSVIVSQTCDLRNVSPQLLECLLLSSTKTIQKGN